MLIVTLALLKFMSALLGTNVKQKGGKLASLGHLLFLVLMLQWPTWP